MEVDEFIAAYKQMGIDDPVGLTEMFDKIDVNDDGTLEWREFINYMLYRCPMLLPHPRVAQLVSDAVMDVS